MLTPASRLLDRLLTALHRRAVAARVADRVAPGLLAGAAATAGLAVALGCQGRPAAPAVAALAVGGVTGLVWGVARRPTRVAAAIRADELLGTDDLLGTAAAVGRSGDDRA
ncbi:MAG: hypothetical protein JWO31_2799, partial [Phycisphaerales bacterium]|nr:hypothetical protein [Phycisphaerales bacterium]